MAGILGQKSCERRTGGGADVGVGACGGEQAVDSGHLQHGRDGDQVEREERAGRSVKACRTAAHPLSVSDFPTLPLPLRPFHGQI